METRTRIADFGGDVITPDDAAYEEGRRIFTPLADRRPAVIAMCRTEADVQAAVRHAVANDLEIAVRSVGHSVPGHSTLDGGIIIDLSALRGVEVDERQRRARVEPGLTASEVADALAPHGLVAAAGIEAAPGFVGLAIHGGRGLLGRRHGWSSDHIVGARLVTAAGDAIAVSPDEHADLLYGLRGLGSSFGIVTELEVAVHPVPEAITAGPRIFGPDQLRDVVPALLALLDDDEVSDDLDAMFTFFQDGGSTYLEFHLLHVGDPADAQRDIARVDAIAAPLEDSTGRSSYADYLRGSDHPSLPRPVWSEQGAAVSGAELADALVEAAERLPGSATDGIPNHYLVSEPFGRGFLREPALPTPVPARGAANVAFFGLWADPARDAEMTAWAATCGEQLTRAGIGNGVPLLNYNSVTGPAAVRRAYGDEAYRRLQGLKRRYDPDGVFHHNHGGDLPN